MRRNLFFVIVIGALELALLGVTANAQNISTIAGGGPPNGLTATTVPIGNPWAVVQDSASGDIYISDSLSNRVFKLASGKISVVAGNSVNNFAGDGGPAVTASLSTPQGIALDKNGNLYIADSGNHVIRVVNTQSSGDFTLFQGTLFQIIVHPGDIATIAGTGTKCTTPASCGDNGAASAAQLNAPSGVAVDGSGDIFIADTGDNVIRKVSATGANTGKIQAVAGNYNVCITAPCGDGGVATSAQLTSPAGLYLDGTGNIYIADTGDSAAHPDSAVRVVNLSGSTNTFFGVSISNTFIETVAGKLLTPCTTGTTTSCGDGALSAIGAGVELNAPDDVFLDGGGNLWIADSGDAVIRKVTSAGAISLVAGNYTFGFAGDGGAAIGAVLSGPSGVAVISSGDVLIADLNNNALRDVHGLNISTIAGIGLTRSYYGDGGLAANAEVRPQGLVLDTAGDIFVADAGNNAIRKIDTKGNITNVAGTGKICPNIGTCNDKGPAAAATLAFPSAVALDKSGNVYFADTEDNAIRVVNTQSTAISFFPDTANTFFIQPGDIATVAGTVNSACPKLPCGSGDNGPANLALLGNPSGVALDKSGNIYIADTGDNAIRVANTQSTPITLAGVTIAAGDIAVVAGDKTYAACALSTDACGDKAAASQAQLNGPTAVSVDASGIIYIADSGDNRIRAVNPQASGSVTVAGVSIAAGDIDTIAGDGDAGYQGDGFAGTSARFNKPDSLFVDIAGNVFISDTFNSVVREVNSFGNTQTVAGNATFGFSGDGGPAVDAELALPQGLVIDATGDLLIADLGAWRIRKVTALEVGPTANLSATSLTFSSQTVGSTSSAQTVTIANKGTAALTVATVAISGADAGDFKQTNTCTSVAVGGGTCLITVTFAPTAGGTRTGTITITDNAGGVANSRQTVSLTGTGSTFTLPTPAALSPASVAAGGSATSTITVTSTDGFSAAIAFTCSVSPSTSSLAPTCSLQPASVTPVAGKSATTMLTVNTTPASSAALSPMLRHNSGPMYALWLPISGLALAGMGVASERSRRKKLVGLLLAGLLIAGFVFQVACGGGSSNTGGGGGGGSSGTPAGAYTITVTAKAGSITQTANLNLTVQ